MPSSLEESDTSLPHPSTNHGTGTHDAVPIHVAEQVQQEEVLNCDMKLLRVAYVSGFIARHVLSGINCDDCPTCLTSPLLLATNAFIYFKGYEGDKLFLNYPSEKLVGTVSASMSLLEFQVTHMSSIEQMTEAIKETFDFGWIGSFALLLHSQKIVDGIVRGITRFAIPGWCKQTNRSMSKARRQRATKRKMKILSHKLVSRKVMPLFFFPMTSGVSTNSLSPAHYVRCKHHDSCYITQCCHNDS